MSQARSAFVSDQTNPGTRVALSGMKDVNKKYGLGTVNTAIAGYEQRLCNLFKNSQFEVKVVKTDFKGYFIQCSPMPNCASRVSSTLEQLEGPKFADGASMRTSSSTAPNYQEGYIKARAREVYPNFNGELTDLIKREMDEGIKEAARLGDYKAELVKNIDIYRAQGIDAVKPELRRLITALDTLLEVPFANSSNIDRSLQTIIDGRNTLGGISIQTAKTGDDYFAIIKHGDEIERVIGIDAKGLGTLNILKRFEEYESLTSQGKAIDKVEDIFELSNKAMAQADKAMADSFEQFDSNLRSAFADQSLLSVDERIRMAHEHYAAQRNLDSNLMQMRSGVISNCAGSTSGEIMDRITMIHNGLKKLEEAGINEFYPTSCLGINYLLIKHGL